MEKLIVILGPTATGKTSLALKLCHEFGGGIVSADSRQVYKGMDIGTGKIFLNSKVEKRRSKWEAAGIPIYLYDVLGPDRRLTVVDYARLARAEIESLRRRKKVPFLVGGTGFYIDVVLGRVKTAGVAPDWKLRGELGNLRAAELRTLLEKLDARRLAVMNKSDRENPHRLIRAIEIAKQAKKVEIRGRNGVLKFKEQGGGNALLIGLTAPRDILYRLIDLRVEAMFRRGLLAEVKTLVEKYGWPAPGMKSVGYFEFKPFLAGKQSLEAVKERVKFNTHAYARRQLTYFKRRENIFWHDIAEAGFDRRVARLVKSYLR